MTTRDEGKFQNCYIVMDLLDLIGDSRTDSLPAGFLKSIKMKYKQETSHVFPPGTPYSTKDVAKPKSALTGEHKADSAESTASVPSFMGWRVPSRILQKHRITQPQSPGSCDGRRENTASRMSAISRRSLEKDENQLPRLESANSARKSPLERNKTPAQKTSLPSMANLYEKSLAEDRRIISQRLEEAQKDMFQKSMDKTMHPKSFDSVEKWLKTATDKEREIALKFFSTLSGVKAEKLGAVGIKLQHDHSEGNCDICDTGRIEGTLEALARNDTVMSRGKLLYNPKRAPDITKQSYYQKARQRLPAHVRQQYQTWHHLPVYTVASDAAANKSAMFTQPHRYYGRHFTIHPEWGLHKPIVL